LHCDDAPVIWALFTGEPNFSKKDGWRCLDVRSLHLD
jgi:hypothetical protein